MEEAAVAEVVVVTPGEVLGKASQVRAGRGAYVAPHNNLVYASLTGFRRTLSPPPNSPDQRPTVEVTGHKAHGAVPEPGSVVIARVTRVTARVASADIMCVGPKSVREKFTGSISTWAGGSIFGEEEVSLAIKNMNGDKAPDSYGFDIAFLPKMLRSGQSRGEVAIGLSCKRQQDVRATEIDKVDMHLSFRPGDIIRAVVLSLGDARAYYLSTAKNELGVVSAESTAGETMVPISWTEMQCPLTGQIEQRKVAKVGG